MWKRINNPKGSRQPTIGAPSTVDASFDNESFSARVARDSGMATRKQVPPHSQRDRPPPPRPSRQDMAPLALPRLPFHPDPPPPPPPPVDQEVILRPASSLYSQPSPVPLAGPFPQDQYAVKNHGAEVVSPPSSPELGAASRARNRVHTNQADEDVSPVDEMPDISTLGLGRPPSRTDTSKPPSSSIPTLRREKKRVAAAAAMMNRRENSGHRERQAVDPRWDPYSGEITTSEKGKPQSVKPGQFGSGLRSVHMDNALTLGTVTNISGPETANHTTSIGERFRKLKGQVVAEKPEWKGATGRSAIVPPVSDRNDVAPLHIPRKSSKRVASPVSAAHSGASTPATIIRSGDGETSPTVSTQHMHDTDPAILSVLTNAGRMDTSSTKDVTPDPHVVKDSAAARTLARGSESRASAQTPSRAQSSQYESPPSTIERHLHEALQNSFPATSDQYVQPPSRFSVTTYAPSEAHSTPRPSIDTFEPMPQPPMPTTPVINRRRPKAMESPPQPTITRKAVAPSSPIFISMSSSNPVSRRTSNIAKNLPRTPAESASHDLVTSLQAQLDDLAHRRNNITKSIRQMTELMPKDNLLVKEEVRAKRELEKIKVERLRVEEADVRREEHEVGLRLHRAWKRRDKDAVFEPTGLWVRRVTGVGRNWAVLRPNTTV